MADYNIVTHRSTIHQEALATLGTDPAWDKALHSYLRADALQHADLEYGEVAKIRLRHEYEEIELADKFGRDWKKHPGAKDEWNRIRAESDAADDRWTERYCRPLWRAANELALTPAPTLAAAMFKATLIETEEVWNDRDFPADAMDVLQSDFARLAREA